MSAAMSVAGYAVHVGIIMPDGQSALATELVAVGAGAITVAIGWYKARQVSQTAMIQAVNSADNGVKVVASSATAPKVDAPLK